MTGSSSRNPVFSGLTLALFEDSGWYTVDYSVAEPLLWGAGMGCDFVEKSCSDWTTSNGYVRQPEQVRRPPRLSMVTNCYYIIATTALMPLRTQFALLTIKHEEPAT